MERQPPSLHQCYETVYRMLKQSQVLEKYASASNDALELKSSQALDLLHYIKEASKGEALRQLVGKVPEGVRKGLAYGAGAMVPVTAGGAYLMHRGGEEAKDTATHIRNQALLAALGIGGVGAGLMGVHRALTPSKQTSVSYGMTPEGLRPQAVHINKTGSVHEEDLLIEKLATVGFLDVVLEEQEKNGADATIRRDAAECRRLNAEHGVDILQQMLA